MLLFFISHSQTVRDVTLHYFETNHGQSEGDSMHSTIERAIRRVSDIFVPSQLASICKMARTKPKPYRVFTIQSSDIQDWKSCSQKSGILRVRFSEDGQSIDWTQFKQVKVVKDKPDEILFKYSHTNDAFSVIKLHKSRRGTDTELLQPQPCYSSGKPKISETKYQDLLKLCSGTTPVVSHPDYQTFYRLLPH